MSLRRGFKSEADQYAREMRDELDLTKHAPLCPWQLASHLEIPIVPLSALRLAAPMAIDYLMRRGSADFSAVTIFCGQHGCKRLVCHNDGHAKTRQAANIAHELSHAILGHPATKPFEVDAIAEEEAKWMGPAILVSQDCAVHIVRCNKAIDVAAIEYGVSETLMRMRLNVTGVLKRARRLRQRHSA